MRTRKEIRKQLIRGVFGSFTDWRLAVEEARDNGWTMGQVNLILFLYHPFTYVVLLPAIIVIFFMGVMAASN